MSFLKQEPPQPVRSLGELFAIAQAIADEAAAQYSKMAQRFQAQQNPPLAALFEHLATQELGHRDSIIRRSEKETGRSPDPALIRWKVPETFDDEGASTTDAHLLDAYRSLSMAVRNEERTFAFWTYVVAHAQHADVRRAAEAMAEEELEHVAALRRERRRAYHEARAESTRHPAVQNEAAVLERILADQIAGQAKNVEPNRLARFRALEDDTRKIADELTRKPLTLPLKTISYETPEESVALAELLVERYLEAAEHLPDEQSMLRAQTLAARAINRLAWLRNDLIALDRPPTNS